MCGVETTPRSEILAATLRPRSAKSIALSSGLSQTAERGMRILPPPYSSTWPRIDASDLARLRVFSSLFNTIPTQLELPAASDLTCCPLTTFWIVVAAMVRSWSVPSKHFVTPETTTSIDVVRSTTVCQAR